MADLISKSALCANIKEQECKPCPYEGTGKCERCSVGRLLKTITYAPTIEAIPVEWVQKQMSECVSYSIVWVVLRDLLREWGRERR